jgi:putative sterol carrier protein
LQGCVFPETLAHIQQPIGNPVVIAKAANMFWQKGIGKAMNPDAIVEAPFDLWMDILSGKANAIQMLMEGKCSTERNLALLTSMSQWFSLNSPV